MIWPYRQPEDAFTRAGIVRQRAGCLLHFQFYVLIGDGMACPECFKNARLVDPRSLTPQKQSR